MMVNARRLTTLLALVSLAVIFGCGKPADSNKKTKVSPDLPAPNTTDSK